jgi:hypothetical protein
MKKVLLVGAFVLGGCGGAGEVDEQQSALSTPHRHYAAGTNPGQFSDIDFDGKGGFHGKLCVGAGCGPSETFSISGRGTVATGRSTTLHFSNGWGAANGVCAALASLPNAADVALLVTPNGASEVVLENLCDGTSYSMTN